MKKLETLLNWDNDITKTTADDAITHIQHVVRVGRGSKDVPNVKIEACTEYRNFGYIRIEYETVMFARGSSFGSGPTTSHVLIRWDIMRRDIMMSGEVQVSESYGRMANVHLRTSMLVEMLKHMDRSTIPVAKPKSPPKATTWEW